MLAPPWIRFNPANVYSTILKSQIMKRDGGPRDDASYDDFKDSRGIGGQSVQHRTSMSYISKSNLFKEPQLYSKDIEI